MATTAKLTLDEFLRQEETEPASEYIDGEVVQKLMPTGWHGVVQRLLSFVFTLYIRQHSGFDAGSEIRCIFGPPDHDRAYVPDFVVIDRRTHAALWNGPVRGAPDVAIEILSPDDRAGRVMDKVYFYLTNGVRLVWVINPVLRCVVVHPSLTESRTLFENDTLDGGDVLPGFRVPVRDILPPPDQPA